MNITSRTTLRSTLKTACILIMITAAVFTGMMLAGEEPSYAKVASAATKKAKTYAKSKNKLFKVSGAWYCFSKKKVKTGLQKVSGKYYFFNKSTGKMYLKTGQKKGLCFL